MFLTIDDYYDTNFYNECIEALKNNKVEFNEFISTAAPYNFYFEVQDDDSPKFINYDEVPRSYNRFLVNKIIALNPKDDYIYQRRTTYVNKAALDHYAVNDALETAEQSGEGIFFTATKEEILKISKEYPRKMFYMGRYFNRKYKVYFTDNLIVKNYLTKNQILVESNSFNHVTDLETELNLKIFHLKDRLVKLSETPYVLKGKIKTMGSIRPEVSDRFVIS